MFKIKNMNYRHRSKDISKLFNIKDISKGSITIDNITENLAIHIYKIEPVLLINITENIKSLILSKYTEFLREIDCDFQIYIESRKIDGNKYFDTNESINVGRNSSSNYINLFNQYKSSINQLFFNQKIYIKNYYIVFSLNQKNLDKEKQIQSCLLKLNDLGCNVIRISDDNELKDLIYESINKIKINNEEKKYNGY